MTQAPSVAQKPIRTRWQQIARRIRVPLGFCFAAIFLAAADPDGRSILLSALPVGAGLALRAYASGYVRKNAELTVTGPYAYTRNPLYLGSMLVALGFALAASSWPLLILLTAGFLAIYLPVIKAEEIYLRAHFLNFDAYAALVPALLPRLTPARVPNQASGAFSTALYRQHREYNASMGVAALYLALALRLLLLHPSLPR